MELTLCVCLRAPRKFREKGETEAERRSGEGSQAEQTQKKKKQRRGENSHPQQMCCEAFVSGWQVHYHRLMRSLVLPVASIRGALPPIPSPSIRSDINSHSGTECTHSQAHTHRCVHSTSTYSTGKDTNILKKSMQGIIACGVHWFNNIVILYRR